MSEYNSKATATIEIGGNAEEKLKKLKERAFDLQNAIAKAASEGNKVNLKKLQSELRKTRQEIKDCDSEAHGVESVMKRLDKATPKELNKTLSTLKKQLNNIERGSSAWDAQVEKIKLVKAEINSVNKSFTEQEGLFSRINNRINQWGMSIASAAAAFTGLVVSGKTAVSIYAEMEQEMANVRKFTGMTAKQVEDLNNEFKNIDTRTSREDLNKLAEEAGRLGKTSKEDVLGFVLAANQINVALDDLGDGATLTLSKITNIFGDEKRLGTEKSLLAVGSVINELSQNCTASAPYLAEFAKRLAGVGAQAGMTVQQVMSFAAVLDSQGQNVEASATAISQLIMKMFQDPAKIAKATGIEIDKFNQVLKTSTNDALLLLLDRLHELGGIDTLAPVFESMGTDGARASQVIAALAGNVDTVRYEQEEANKAFIEATSVTNEYNVQNNTVQANLEKTKKKFTEMAFTLGQQLLPVMKYAISGTSAAMRVLSTIISFIVENKRAIITLSVAILAYNIAVNASNILLKAHYAWLVATKTAQLLMSKTTLILQMAFYALTGQIEKTKAAYTAFHLLTKSTPWGWIVAGITAVVSGLVIMTAKLLEASEAEKAINEIKKTVNAETSEQISKIDILNKKIHDNTLSNYERAKAIDELREIIPGYNGMINEEGKLIRDNTSAVNDYIEALKRQAKMKAAQDKLADLYKQKLDAKDKIDKFSSKSFLGGVWQMIGHLDLDSALGDALSTMKNVDEQIDSISKFAGITVDHANGLSTEFEKVNKDLYNTNKKYKQAVDKIEKEYQSNKSNGMSIQADSKFFSKILDKRNVSLYDLNKKYQDKNINLGSQHENPPLSGGNTSNKTDKFSAVNNWKEKENAINRIAYATGKKDYEDYLSTINSIEVECQEKKLEIAQKGSAEYLTIQASFEEAKQKEIGNWVSENEREINNAYTEQLAMAKQYYIDGQTSLETFSNIEQRLELEKLRKLAQIGENGSEERLKNENNYREALVQDKKKHQEKTLADEKKYQEYLNSIKKDYFGDNASENKENYDKAMEGLNIVYQAELIAAANNSDEKLRIEEAFQKAKVAIAQKYNQDSGKDMLNSFQKANQDIVDWLDSDSGQSVVKAMDVISSGMSSIFSQMSSIVQAELEIQTAAIEKRYDAEISRAEGNNYKVKKIEEKKEKEIAKAKNDANKKMFAMQVIQAVAQTAQNAISAYGAGLSVGGPAGLVLAPIAAAMAVAAGALQIAAIQKQQQASESQGYAEGGFTPKGTKYQEVGVVHAGEWVASQKLVNDPKTRLIINALDYAQRTNTIGSILPSDATTKMIATQPSEIRQNQESIDVIKSNAIVLSYTADILKQLEKRLNQPFVTVNTITGDLGINQAQEEYKKLMKNKSRKS